MVPRRPFATTGSEPANEISNATDPDREIDALRARVAELESTAKDFLTAAAHEIKSPLTIIQSYLEIVLNDLSDGLSDDQRSFIGTAYDSTMKLRQLVLDLVDLVAHTVGKTTFDLGKVDVISTIDKTTHEFSLIADRNSISLVTDVADQLPPVRADAEYLIDVLRRLIENAVRFTLPNGKIAIRAFEEESHVTIEVSDTGVGIPDERLETVFEAFVRGPRERGRPRDGAGLGLAISRLLIEAFGGTISISSTPDVGTTVRIELEPWHEPAD